MYVVKILLQQPENTACELSFVCYVLHVSDSICKSIFSSTINVFQEMFLKQGATINNSILITTCIECNTFVKQGCSCTIINTVHAARNSHICTNSI